MINNKKVLLSGYIGFSNFGDDAMLEVIIRYLKTQNCEISTLSSNPKLTKEMFKVNSAYYFNPISIFKEILKSDIVIQGGGNLLQDGTSFFSLLYYLMIIVISKLLFKKVVLYSQGIGPLKSFISTILVRFVLYFVDLITVRDTYSKNLLMKWGIKAKYTYDAVWSLETNEYNPKNIIGIQLRNYDKFHEKFISTLAKYVDMFFSDALIKIYSFQNTSDASVAYQFEKQLKSRNMQIKTQVVLYKNPAQIVQEFSELKYLIGMRLHGNILALKYGVGIVPVIYNSKVKNFADEFDIKYINPTIEDNFHSVLTDLTLSPQTSGKIQDARKRKFNWSLLDSIIKK